MIVHQFRCDACLTTWDEDEARASQSWVVVTVTAEVKPGFSCKVSKTHLCPNCVPLLAPLGINAKRFATPFGDDPE